MKGVLKSEIKVFLSCSVIHKNAMYIYGGDKQYTNGDPYQIAKALFSKTENL